MQNVVDVVVVVVVVVVEVVVVVVVVVVVAVTTLTPHLNNIFVRRHRKPITRRGRKIIMGPV